MKNEIVASVEFYFKGERYSPKATIDLDRLMLNKNHGHDMLALIHPLLAKDNGIDAYSYQFEMMMGETIQFSQATGIAVYYCQDGIFLFDDFEKAWHENLIQKHIQTIAKQHLAIDDLSQHEDLKTALTEAYMLGKSKADNSSD